ncbi:MAG: hypothetical protein GXP55_23520, partial [Deltaproteobacteria bacterium]|nr:hypothetical protein [Deltaproteobacteria bacterium]
GRVMPAGAFSIRSAPPGVTPRGRPGRRVGGPLSVSVIQPRCLRPGCRVVIVGRGFSSSVRQNRVRFGGRPVRVIRARPDSLTVTIPNVHGMHPFVIDVRGVGTIQSPPLAIP